MEKQDKQEEKKLTIIEFLITASKITNVNQLDELLKKYPEYINKHINLGRKPVPMIYRIIIDYNVTRYKNRADLLIVWIQNKVNLNCMIKGYSLLYKTSRLNDSTEEELTDVLIDFNARLLHSEVFGLLGHKLIRKGIVIDHKIVKYIISYLITT
jgi:hypothetical protein